MDQSPHESNDHVIRMEPRPPGTKRPEKKQMEVHRMNRWVCVCVCVCVCECECVCLSVSVFEGLSVCLYACLCEIKSLCVLCV